MGRKRSASSSSSSSSSASGSDSESSSSSSDATSGSGSSSSSSTSGEERRAARRQKRAKKKERGNELDVARLRQQLRHVERLQLLRRVAAAEAEAEADAEPKPDAAPLSSPPERKRKTKKPNKADKKEKRTKRKEKEKQKKRKRNKRAKTPRSEPEEDVSEKLYASKLKDVRLEKRLSQTPPSTALDERYQNEENVRKRKITHEMKDDIPDYQCDKDYNKEHNRRYAKEKYVDDKSYESDRVYSNKSESRYTESNAQQKYPENVPNRPYNHNREEFDNKNDKDRHNLSYDLKRRRFDKDEADDGYANDHKKYPTYDRQDRYKRNDNYKGRNDNPRESRHFSPHRNDNPRVNRNFSPNRNDDQNRDGRAGNNAHYSKPPRSDYEQRDYSNRRRDDNGSGKRDFRQQHESRGHNNRDYHSRNDFPQNHGRNERKYDSQYSNDPEASHNKDTVPSTSGRNEKFQRPNDRDRFDSKDRRNTSSNFERRDPPRGNRRPNSSDKDKDDQSYEWGKKEKKPVDNSGSEKAPKDKPNFALSGKLTEETNMVNGVVIKYSEPPEGKQPKRRWRFYPFKGETALPILYLHRQSFFLLGRDRTIADIPLDHPSISKQHAVLQYRLVPFKRDDGSTGKRVRPYIIDLGSSNGTFVNNKQIEPSKYVELLERDVVKFGFSQREYVLLHENSKDDGDMDDDDVKPNIKLEDIKKIIKQENETEN